MRKFVFKLEPLYEYRQRLEEVCRKEFGEALRKLEEEETRLAVFNEAYKKSSAEIDEMKEKGGSAQDFGIYYAYLHGLKSNIEGQEEIIRQLREVLEGRRAKLIESSKGKKVIEIMKEKSMESHMQKLNRDEQKISDDQVSSRFKRSTANEA